MSVLLLLLLGTIWGSGYSLAKYATTHGVSPIGYSFWQCVGPGIILLLVNCFQSSKIKEFLKLKNLLFFVISGLLGLALPNAIMYSVAPILPSGLLSIIVNIVPVITFLLTVLLGINRFNWSMCWAVLLTTLGLILIFFPSLSLVSVDLLPNVLLALIVPICFASYAIYVQTYRPADLSASVMALGMLWSATLIQTPIVFYLHQFYFFNLTPTLVDWSVLLEIILSSLGYIVLFKLIRIAGANYYSLVPAVVVVVSLLLGRLIFNEIINYYVIGALICIILAIFLATKQLQSSQ